MKQFNKLVGYPPELRGRWNSFIVTEFDDSMTIEMQLRVLIKWIKANIELTDSMVDYLNNFIKTFDEKLYTTVMDILTEWFESGKFNEILNEVIFQEILDELHKALFYRKITLKKESKDVRVNYTRNDYTIALSTPTHNFEKGDLVAIEDAGTPKNQVAFLINFLSGASKDGNIYIMINGIEYIVEAKKGDTAFDLSKKLSEIPLPFNLISQNVSCLYSTLNYEQVTIVINSEDAGASLSYLIDNNVERNFLRTEVVKVEGNILTLKDPVQTTKSHVRILHDDTLYIQSQINQAMIENRIVYLDAGHFYIFDKLDFIENASNFSFQGIGKTAILDASGCVGTKTPYFYSRMIGYFTDGQIFNFRFSSNITFKDFTFIGKEQALVVLRNTQNVIFSNVSFYQHNSYFMNHACVGLYSDKEGQIATKYRFIDCDFNTGGMCLISLGDFDNPINDLKIRDCNFTLRENGNYGKEAIAEHVKIDNNSYNIDIYQCNFNGGELSSVTLEEGTSDVNISFCKFNKTKNQSIRIAYGQTQKTLKRININNCQFYDFVFAIRVEPSLVVNTVEGLTISDCLVDNGKVPNVNSLIHISTSKDITISRNEILNPEFSTASLIIIQTSYNILIDGNKIREIGNVDIGQVRILNSEGVLSTNNKIGILTYYGVKKGDIVDNIFYGRLECQNNIDVRILRNNIGLDDNKTIGKYYSLINIWNKQGDNPFESNYFIGYNYFYSTYVVGVGEEGEVRATAIRKPTSDITYKQEFSSLDGVFLESKTTNGGASAK